MNFYNENDPKAAAWLRELIKRGLIADGIVDERSIVELQPQDLDGYIQCHFFAGIGGWSVALRLAGWTDTRPVWTASLPCQPFSTAGHKIGAKDDRHLWPYFFRLISQCRPLTIFGEQVARSVGYRWLDSICADMEEKTYAIGACVLGAHSKGRCHIRQRLFWGAFADAERHEQPRQEPRHGQAGRMGGCSQPVPWDRDWKSALREFRALDDGLSYGVEICDGARNAIVPQVAAEFIQAFDEACRKDLNF